MSNSGLPPIQYTDTLKFQGFIAAAKKNPNILRGDDHGYAEDVLPVLKILVRGIYADAVDLNTIPDDTEDMFLDRDDYEVLEEQIKQSLSRLSTLQRSVSGESNATRINYEKTVVALLDKLTTIKQKTTDQKEVAQFKQKVMEAFEGVLTKDQRTQVMELLNTHA